MTETDPLWEAYFANPDPGRAALLDGQAVADPTKASAQEKALGELLTEILGYRPKRCPHHARRLLLECDNDYDGLRCMITAMRLEGRLSWVQQKKVRVYGLVNVLADEYEALRQSKAGAEARRAEWAAASEWSWEAFLEKHPEYRGPDCLGGQLRAMGKEA